MARGIADEPDARRSREAGQRLVQDRHQSRQFSEAIQRGGFERCSPTVRKKPKYKMSAPAIQEIA
jgi:hypothetical protein